MIRFILNEKEISTDLPLGSVLLDLIRYNQHLTGTKIGCREGDCGACTVLIGELSEGPTGKSGVLVYQSMTSCLVPLANIHGKHVVTVEGINMEGLNPVQQAMAEAGATQCGFCTPGFVMSLAGFCLGRQEINQKNAIAAIDGNICRCTGYKSIERAAEKVVAFMQDRKNTAPEKYAANNKILPSYFALIPERLKALQQKTNGVFVDSSNEKGIVGGGTDLYVQKHDEMTHASSHFVFDRPELNGIRKEANRCMIGPSATVSDLRNSPVIHEVFPAFERYSKLVSSTPIRNMATIAGNFINASPIGDFTIFFLALDAQLILSDGRKKRELPLRKLYKGYKTLDKLPAEFIEQVWFEVPSPTDRFHFEKVSKRTHLDIASVNSAIRLRMNGEVIESGGIAAGGVGPVPLFLEKTSNYLKGKKVSYALLEELLEIMKTEISPISDARGSKEYKTLLLGQLIRAHFMVLFPELDIIEMPR